VTRSDTGISGLEVTRGEPKARTLSGAPEGRAWIYQGSMPFQVAQGKAALFWSIREGMARGADFEHGVDVVVFDDLSAISAQGAVAVTRNHEETNPNSNPPGQPAIMVKYPISGGFQPLGANRADGSPLPHQGTGFGINQAIAWRTDFPEAPPYRVNYYRDAERHHYLELHQFSYDGRTFRVESSQRVPLTELLAGWIVEGGAMTNAIPDGDDLLIGMRAMRFDPATENENALISANTLGAGVMRWRRGTDGWRPVSFAPVTNGDVSFEPSLVRDLDGSLLFCARAGREAEYNDIRVWRSRDGYSDWKKVVDVPGPISNAPVTINQTADGTPYISANLYEVNLHPGERVAIYRDSRGRARGGGWTRKTLCLWPLNEDRTGLQAPVVARDCQAAWGPPPGGSIWVADHPSGMTVHLADGEWHHVLAYRVLELGEISHALEPTSQTGGFVEEVLSTGPAVPIWNF
jgi:hypothetical protein